MNRNWFSSCKQTALARGEGLRFGIPALAAAFFLTLALPARAPAAYYAQDDASDSAYSSGWSTGNNGGSGFGSWTLTTLGGGGGFWTGTSESDIDVSTKSWGCWAWYSDVSEAVRPFTTSMKSGDKFYVKLDHGGIDTGQSVGWELRNGSNEPLFVLSFVGGASQYTYVDSSGVHLTSSTGWTNQGLEFTFTLTSSTAYSLYIYRKTSATNETVTGSLISPPGGQTVSKFRMWNSSQSGDGGSGFNVYLNSLALEDPIAPTVTGVSVVDGSNVDVTFSEAMDSGVTTAANYTVSGTGQGSLASNPNSVALQSGNTYRLTWSSGEMVNGGNITVTVANAQDVAGNPVGTPNNGTHTGGGIGVAPTVSTVAVVDGTHVDVTFSEPMGTGATTAANYTVSGTGQGTFTANPNTAALQSGNTYRLTWSSGEMLNGGDITITVANAQDAAGNPIGTPNSDTDLGGAIGVAPTVSTVTVVDGTHVDVTFSEAMGGSGVTTASNYTVSGTGKGTFANNPNSVALQSGNTYRLTWSSGEMLNGGDITVTVANAQDAAGNAIGAPNNGTDLGGAIGTAPTVTDVSVFNGLNVDITFSEAMKAPGVTTAGNYTVTGTGSGTLASNPTGVVAQGGNVYRLTWSSGEMKNGGDITITVSNSPNAVEDLAGNDIGSPRAMTDTGGAIGVAPTVSTVAVVDGTHVDVTFSEPMGTGVTTAANYTVSGTGQGTLAGNPTSVANTTGNTYRLTWSSGEMLNGGDITVTVVNAQDAAGNTIGSPNSGTHSGGAIGVAPTVSTVAVFDGTHVDVTFSEPMGTGATTAANYTVSGTGQGTFTANPNTAALQSGNTYRLTWSSGEMLNGGDITVTVANAQDAAGNPIGAPNNGTDLGGAIGTAPTVTDVSVFNGLNVDITFGEAMKAPGVTTAGNYTVSGTGMGTLASNPTSVAAQGGNVYRLTWSTGEMKNGGDITITVSNSPNAVEDLAGNDIGSPRAMTDTGGAIGVAPTVSTVAVVDGTHVDVTFSEAMGGAGVTTASNYTVSGTGQGTFANNPTGVALQIGNTYRLTWSSGEMKNGGDITITVSSSALDLAGNGVGSPNSGTDTGGAIGVAPTVSTVAVVDGTHVDVTFSEPMGGAGVTTASNYTVSGTGQGTFANNPNGVALQSGNTYRLTWSSGEMKNGGDITITVSSSALDLAGNGVGSPNSGTDTGGAIGVAPTVQTVAVVDGTHVDVTFSEPMGNGVTSAANYTVSGTGRGTLALHPNGVVFQSGNRYRLTWSSGEMKIGGNITITVDATVEDLAANAMGSPSSGTDVGGGVGVAPSVQSESPARTTTVSSLPSVQVTFTESVTGIVPGNLTVNGSAATSIGGSGAGPYTFTGYTVPSDGAVTVNFVTGSIIDGAGNSFAGDSWGYTKNSSLPTVILASTTVSNGGAAKTAASFTATFSEGVSGLLSGEISVANGSVANFVPQSSTLYTFDVNPTAEGAVTVQVPSDVATATTPPNNGNAASGVYSFTYDVTPPVSSASAPALQVAGVIAGTYTASDGAGSGVTTVTLYARRPGQSWAGEGTVTGNSFFLNPVEGDGIYYVQTVAEDAAGNSETAPSGATGNGDSWTVFNDIANSALTLSIDTATSLTFPMENGVKVRINFLTLGAPGTVTVSRVESPASVPSGIGVDNLIDEMLVISSTGLGAFTATIEWEYQLANGLPPSSINAAFRWDGATWQTINSGVSSDGSTVTITGVTGFSDWYAGNLAATGVEDWTLMK